MSRLFEQLLRVRGADGDFLCPKYESCIDPLLLPDVGAAVERLRSAIDGNERVMIYGDYDVDGVTASAVMYDTLKLAGIKEVRVMLPNRFTDGYGMSKKLVQEAIESRVNLVFTVDCGSRNFEIIAELKRAGIDTIVTDHHECEETLPEAVAVINPKRRDCVVEDDLRNLAGVGVAFKFAQALVRADLIPEGQEKWLLDLVVLGTVCDSMLLTGENRRLCYYGMTVLGKTRRSGLKELMNLAGVKNLNGETIGFQIGPRLNAAGRMDTAERALNLLMARGRSEAAELALELEELNKQRKVQQLAALEEIRKRGVEDGPVIVERGDWHEGILGIVAGRLTEEYKRPAFVLSENDGVLKGSGRSFGDFSLAEALEACQQSIIGGGGHAEACGVKVAIDKLEEFRQKVNQYYGSLDLKDQERFLSVREDLRVEDFSELTLELLDELKSLEPYGLGNQEPVFLLPEVRVVEAAKLGADQRHLRLVVWDHFGNSLKLMSFYASEDYLNIQGGETLNAWITLSENNYRGIRSVEGRILRLAD